MAKYSIISKDSSSVRYSGRPRYNGSFMNVSYVEFPQIASPVPIEWEIGDYVYYDRLGRYFRLYYLPKPKRQGANDKYGAAFLYENVQFHDGTKMLEIVPFADYVKNDNLIHFSSRNSASTYENVAGIARRIASCLNLHYPDLWDIRVIDPESSIEDDDEKEYKINEVKEFTIEGSCLEALNRISETWGNIGWLYTVEHRSGGLPDLNVVTIGAPNVTSGGVPVNSYADTFLYGRGKGLKVIKTSTANRDELVTRIYPFGSEKNLPIRYYNGKRILNADSVDIPNLMLPIATWGETDGLPDPAKAFIQNNEAVAKYGVIPKRVYFDGSGDSEEIYPTIERVTIGEVRDANPEYIPVERWDAEDRVDEVYSVDSPNDSGYVGDGEDKYTDITSVEVTTGSKEVSISANGREIDVDWPICDINFNAGQSLDIKGTSALLDGARLSFNATFNSCTVVVEIMTCSYNGQNKVYREKELNFSNAEPLPGGGYHFDIELSDIVSYSSSIITYTRVSLKNIIADVSYFDELVTVYKRGTARLGYYTELAANFTMKIRQIGFDLNQQTVLGSGCTISMKDGACAGRDFVVRSCNYNSSDDTWSLQLKRTEDTSLNLLYPYRDYPIAPGDHFVILDIAMPELYVLVAQNRLLKAAQKSLIKQCAEEMQYEAEVDAKVMALESRHLTEGMYMKIGDEDLLDGLDYIMIDSLTINEEESNIPTYQVSLRNKKRKTLGDILNNIQTGAQATVRTVVVTQTEVKKMANRAVSRIGAGEAPSGIIPDVYIGSVVSTISVEDW